VTARELLVVDLYPSLLQPEGDHGNVIALVVRAQQYGIRARSVVVHPGDELPAADIYHLGGSQDLDLPACAERLRKDGALQAAVDRGATVLGVGAGLCVLARHFPDEKGDECKGVGLFDVEIHAAALASGPVVTLPNKTLGLPALSGYEFHAGRAARGPGVTRLADLEIGTGDESPGPGRPATEGAVSGRVVGTWLHGPLLPRNPELADLLLGWSHPDAVSSATLDDTLARSVRERRIAEARPTG
jgi:CobQ-like glutamine amidotransferase family enzyme